MPTDSDPGRTPLRLRHDHVAIRAADYARTVQWYVEKLDFTVDAEWPYDDMQLAFLKNGTATVEILGGSTAEPGAAVPDLESSFATEGYHHFCLWVDDLAGTLAELERRDVPIVAGPFVVEAVGREIAFLKDDNGNLIELSAAA